MKNKDIDLNFFFGLWRIKISTTCKNPHISIINIFWVILKKLIKTTLNFWKSGNKPLSLFFPRGRGHAEIIFWVWDIYRTRSNSFYIFAPHRFPSPLNINSTSQHQADRIGNITFYSPHNWVTNSYSVTCGWQGWFDDGFDFFEPFMK